MLKAVRREKVSLSIMEQIREQIVSGSFRPGDPLPPEKEMTIQLGVSKHTLREALRALEAMGLLEIRKGAGGGPVVCAVDQGLFFDSMVNFFSFQDVSIEDLTQVRALLEPYLARQAALKKDPELVLRLEELNLACQETVAAGRSIVGGKEEIEFHVALAESSGNQVLIALLDFVNRFLAQLKLAKKPGAEFSARVLASHQAITRAIAAGDGERAAKEMEAHVLAVAKDLPDQN